MLNIYMVQYAIFGKFCQNVRNLQNFDFAPIFYQIHHMSCWMSLTASHILESFRMGIFLPDSFPFIDFLHCFLEVCFSFYFYFKFLESDIPFCFAYISASWYRTEMFLYSRRSYGFPLSNEILTSLLVCFYP